MNSAWEGRGELSEEAMLELGLEVKCKIRVEKES